MPRLPFSPCLGHRTLVALTCASCGELKGGDQFERRARVHGGPAYLDRRCRPCRWRHMEGILAMKRLVDHHIDL